MTVFIQQYPLPSYEPPRCNILCVKKSIVDHLNRIVSFSTSIKNKVYKVEIQIVKKLFLLIGNAAVLDIILAN